MSWMDDFFKADAYLREAPGTVSEIVEDGAIVLDRSLFYPAGGGQPGDSGLLVWDGGEMRISTTVKRADGRAALVPEADGPRPEPGEQVLQRLEWERRYAHMRIHTALHLLSVVIPLPVTGGAITAEKGRIDFAMPEPLEDKEALEAKLQALIDRNLPVTESWISEEELDANPGLVKTMSVSPPRGAGRVRLVRIGEGADPVDLQPCGGTHVARTVEIGRIRLGKVEKKGRHNRRVNLHLVS